MRNILSNNMNNASPQHLTSIDPNALEIILIDHSDHQYPNQHPQKRTSLRLKQKITKKQYTNYKNQTIKSQEFQKNQHKIHNVLNLMMSQVNQIEQQIQRINTYISSFLTNLQQVKNDFTVVKNQLNLLSNQKYYLEEKLKNTKTKNIYKQNQSKPQISKRRFQRSKAQLS